MVLRPKYILFIVLNIPEKEDYKALELFNVLDINPNLHYLKTLAKDLTLPYAYSILKGNRYYRLKGGYILDVLECVKNYARDRLRIIDKFGGGLDM